MSKGLWPAVSGGMAQSDRLDQAANNLANVDTNGFKRDQILFKEVMSSAVSAATKEEIPHKLYKEKDFYKLDGRDKSYVMTEGTFTDFGQGRTKVTGAPLDVALEGKGFLEVLAPQGERFTRQGSLRIGADGTLVTMDGFPVLAKGDAGVPASRDELAARAIHLDANKPGAVMINPEGKIYQGAEQVGQLSIVEFVEPGKLVKEGSALFNNSSQANVVQDTPATQVRQGMLETSNVNAVSEMMELLKATRLFEANEKLVKNYGELESRAVNELGKL